MVMTEHRQWRIREVPSYVAAHALEGWWGLNVGCGMKAMAGHCWDGSGVLGGHQLAGWCAAGVSLGGGIIGAIISATIGAVILLFLIRLIKRA